MGVRIGGYDWRVRLWETFAVRNGSGISCRGLETCEHRLLGNHRVFA